MSCLARGESTMSTRLGSKILHRLSETFTATHLVVLFGIAVLAPSVLYATGTFTNVAVTDASSNATAQVDLSHRLRTYDLSAGYTTNPAYAVNITDSHQYEHLSLDLYGAGGKSFADKVRSGLQSGTRRVPIPIITCTTSHPTSCTTQRTFTSPPPHRHAKVEPIENNDFAVP